MKAINLEFSNFFISDISYFQRHSLRGVPVSSVRYVYQGIPRRYWVYGKERCVHCDDYPIGCCASCWAKCWGDDCNIL